MQLCFVIALAIQMWAILNCLFCTTPSGDAAVFWCSSDCPDVSHIKFSNSAHSNFMVIWTEWSLFIPYFIVTQEKGPEIPHAVTHFSTSASDALEFSHCSQYAIITVISSNAAWTYGQCLVSGQAFLPRFRCPGLLITVSYSFQYEKQMRTVLDKTKPGICLGNVGVPGCWLED